MRLNVSVLDELVQEYCVYRGIVDSGPTSAGMQVISGTSNVDQSEPGCLSQNCSVVSDGDVPLNNAYVEDSSETRIDMLGMSNAHIEERYCSNSTNLNKDCSTSGTHQPDDHKVVQRNRSPGTGERNKRRRWRGRNENQEFVTGSCKHDLSVAKSLGDTKMDLNTSSVMNTLSKRGDKYEIVLGIKELASKGMTVEVVEQINYQDPEFFTENPLLLFQLKQVEFLKLVRAGDHHSALKVASSHLGPLAAKDLSLLKPLKETLLTLLKLNEESTVENFQLDALATSLQVAVGRRLGIEEPHLMKIIRATLHSHSEWFKLHMCKDQFEGLLWINSLKELGGHLLGDASCKSFSNTCTQGSSQVTISSGSTRTHEDGNSPNQISSTDLGCDENAILKVMEFLALSRADAIHLLVQYNGNAETLIQHMYA